jgi:hypothetical protein
LSEPALVGVITADGTFHARYLHWAGTPTDTVAALRTIWADHFARDTTAITAALLDHDWDRLCPACQHRRTKATPVTGTPVTVTVTGIGHALAAAQPPVQGSIATADRHGYTEWMYLIDAEAQTIRVYEATIHDRWLPHSEHPLSHGAPPATGRRYRRGDRVALEFIGDDEYVVLRPGDQGHGPARPAAGFPHRDGRVERRHSPVHVARLRRRHSSAHPQPRRDEPAGGELMSIACLIGVRHPGGLNGDTMVRVASGGHPDEMVDTLRLIWWLTFDGDTAALRRQSAAAPLGIPRPGGRRDPTPHRRTGPRHHRPDRPASPPGRPADRPDHHRHRVALPRGPAGRANLGLPGHRGRLGAL